MIRGLYAAASGMLLGLRQQDVIAENMANASTIGYKAEQSSQAAFGNVLARSMGVQAGPLPGTSARMIGGLGTGAYIDKTRTVLTQGSERGTGAALDVMVRGDGFLAIQTVDGVRYTRDGHMDRDAQNQLVNADRSAVLDVNGNPITLESNHVRIKSDGSIYSLTPVDTKQPDGSVTHEDREDLVAQLQVVNIDAQDLVRAGDTQFMLAPNAVATPMNFADGKTAVVQGALEEANVAVGEVATQMYSLARTFESSQRVFSTINETLKTAVRDVGRV